MGGVLGGNREVTVPGAGVGSGCRTRLFQAWPGFGGGARGPGVLAAENVACGGGKPGGCAARHVAGS